ncbi:NAD(P)-binding domain-containing protein [Rhodococcus marinonascens]|uniref:NAD(P)-binding domain-containing protein n=1 Tax=Rhodococcus marinonascens TaxID=38311 RepID=UPI0009341BEB|nr:NAD(P)-binding domain-containing protein [Rhodococcus marinonascens]
MSVSTLKIGWIGVGRMGSELVTRLLDAGHDVTVCNPTASKGQALADHGAAIARRPVDLADHDRVFSMVSSRRDLEEVVTSATERAASPIALPIWCACSATRSPRPCNGCSPTT